MTDYRLLDIDLCLRGHAATPVAEAIADGLVHWRIPTAAAAGMLAIEWAIPAAGAQANWHPDRQFFRGVPMPFARDPLIDSSAFSHAPVQCLHGFDGRNRLTFAVDSLIEAVRLTAEVHEDDGRMHCRIELRPPPQGGVVTLRLARRGLDWQRCIAEVGRWWVPEEDRLPISVGAREVLWCTW